jgi:hypothetical protein
MQMVSFLNPLQKGNGMMNIAKVIKYEGDNETFIWKHPYEDFNSGTQLIVHESQEAVFYMNGQALDSFGPGRYTLETQNMSEYEKLRYVYEYVINAAEYDDTYVYEANYSIVGALLYANSVCTGYSYSLKYLCDNLGIEVIVMVSDTMLHAWNAAYIDGEWYFIDVTWADTAERDFFLQGSDEFMSDDGAGDTHYAINDYLILPEFSNDGYTNNRG